MSMKAEKKLLKFGVMLMHVLGIENTWMGPTHVALHAAAPSLLPRHSSPELVL